MSNFIFKSNITLSGELSSKDATSTEWSNVYSTVKTASAIWNDLTVVNLNTELLTIDGNNDYLYDRKFIDLIHTDHAFITFGSVVKPGFSCRFFNDSTNYIIFQSLIDNVKSKGNTVQDQYGVVNIEFDGQFFYMYGDLVNYYPSITEDQPSTNYILNEDLTILLDENNNYISF